VDRPEWISRAKAAANVTVDVGFLISKTFYYGPENGFSQEQWQQLREPLLQPALEQYGDFLLSAALGESVEELIQYYRDVVRISAKHRKEIRQQSPYFWIRPLIFSRGEFAISFPWYDTWEEALPVLNALVATGDGLLFDDLDQGWQLQMFAEGGHLYLRRSDFDSGEEQCIIAANRAQIAGQVPALRNRVAQQLQELTAALGRDYWSRRW
jgi:hypothetical protein